MLLIFYVTHTHILKSSPSLIIAW